VPDSYVLSEGQGLPSRYPPVRQLDLEKKQRVLVTGGSGFVGSHLVDRLMLMGHEVIVVDNFFTGKKENVAHWVGHPHFELIRHDVVEEILVEVDRIYHLASPASPPQYQYNPIKTIKTNTVGTIHMLGLARRVKARFLMASTSGKFLLPLPLPLPSPPLFSPLMYDFLTGIIFDFLLLLLLFVHFPPRGLW